MTKEELQNEYDNIETHIEMLVLPEILEAAHAEKLSHRPLQLRVMRLLIHLNFISTFKVEK